MLKSKDGLTEEIMRIEQSQESDKSSELEMQLQQIHRDQVAIETQKSHIQTARKQIEEALIREETSMGEATEIQEQARQQISAIQIELETMSNQFEQGSGNMDQLDAKVDSAFESYNEKNILRIQAEAQIRQLESQERFLLEKMEQLDSRIQGATTSFDSGTKELEQINRELEEFANVLAELYEKKEE